MKVQNLKLIARTTEDLRVISAHLQDSIVKTSDNKLKALSKFLNKYCKNHFNNVHILPFFPFSSDDGFSITDYEIVRPDLGNWQDIKLLSKDFRVMSDIVINHASIKSKYFKNFIENRDDTKNFFIKLKTKDTLWIYVTLIR